MAFCSILVQPHNFVLDCELHSAPVYFFASTNILSISALPYPFLVGLYMVTVMTLGESFHANSRNYLEMPLFFFSILYLCIGTLLSYPWAKMLESHHPGFLFSMVIRSKLFVTTISVIDITGKAHTFTFSPYGTVRHWSGSPAKTTPLDFGTKNNFPSFFCQWKGFDTYI